MIQGRVSVIVPSRNERHLQKTVNGLLKNAAGDVEILAVLDGGPWPNPPLVNDKRVIVVRHNEPMGMRPSINEAAQIASGEFLLKTDAHTIFAPGYDEALRADCADNWLVVPTRHSLDAEAWERDGERAAILPRHFNYSYLTFPFSPSMYGYGLHAKTWEWRENKRLNAERAQTPIDDIMGFQGSAWFQRTADFLRLGPLDHDAYYFYSESIECGMRVIVTGGRVVINKRTSYSHYHKGKENQGADGRVGRGFYLDVRKKRQSEAYATDFWMHDRWPGAVRTFRSFIEQHWLLLQRAPEGERWPDDWENPKHRIDFLNRPPELVPQHT